MSDVETVRAFFEAWKAQNWEEMANLSQLSWRMEHPCPADWLREQYGSNRLVGFEMGAIASISPTASRIRTRISYRLGGRQSSRAVEVMVVQECPLDGVAQDGVWGVNPLSPLRKCDAMRAKSTLPTS